MLFRGVDRTPFASGRAEAQFAPATIHDTTTRIHIPIRVDNMQVTAFVDTGGAYLVLSSELARNLNLDPSISIGEVTLYIRGVPIVGHLHRLDVELIASEGNSCTQDITVFAPTNDLGLPVGLPCILGLQGCLEFIRFAVDPIEGHFYFGAGE